MDKLFVVVVISNICEYKRRWELFNEFINRMHEYKDYIELYITELAYNEQEFMVTDKNNSKHYQLRTDYALWHKENLINITIKNKLPNNWKYVAWIDCDIEFNNKLWYEDCINKLQDNDIIQLFEKCINLNYLNEADTTYESICYMHKNNIILNGGHPGYAWACTREYYDKIIGLLDICIVGGSDSKMASCFINKYIPFHYCPEYKKIIEEFYNRSQPCKYDYVNGTINHYYHGQLINRQYENRHMILLSHYYNPYLYLKYDNNGILIPSKHFPEKMLEDIYKYFIDRNEDDIYLFLKKKYIDII